MNDRFGMEAAEEFTNGRVLERFCFVYVVLKVYSFIMAQWLSWLERRPVTAEVVGSSPIRVASSYSKCESCLRLLMRC